MTRALLVFALLFSSSAAIHAQDLLGAKEVLRRIREKQQANAATQAATKEDSGPFGQALTAYLKEREGLAPEVAAERWLSLVEQLPTKDESNQSGHSDDAIWNRLLSALPAPEAWEALARQAAAQPLPADDQAKLLPYGLRLLAHRLQSDREKFKTDIDDVLALAKRHATAKAEPPADDTGLVGNILKQLQGGHRESGPYDSVVETIHRLQVQERLITSVEQFVRELEDVNPEYGGHVNVPDLVALVGRERATELLTKAFQTPMLTLSFDHTPRPTLQLARELALQQIDSLQSPPWSLCQSVETLQLYESLVSRFAEKDNSNAGSFHSFGSDSDSATSFYLRGLILAGRGPDATQLLVGWHSTNPDLQAYEIFQAWRELRDTKAERDTILRFLIELAESHPEIPVWDQLVTTGAAAGGAPEVRQLVERIHQRADLPEKTREKIKELRLQAALAAGDVDDAVAMLQEALREPLEQLSSEEAQEAGSAALKLFTIGQLFKRAEWRDAGFRALDTLFARPAEQQPQTNMSDSKPALQVYIEALIEKQEFAKCEQFLLDQFAAQPTSARDSYPSFSRDASNDALTGVLLARLYLDRGRFEDIVTLLDEGVWWNVDDLGAMTEADSIAYIASRAFEETGRLPVARQIAETLVRHNLGNDKVWRLLLDVAGDDFPALAEQMFQRDQFEERPLIWLATYQLQAGQVAPAEITIRKAIAIDPSDGEQGKGDRMRAYAVLADVLEKKSDPQAELFRGAVRAIRIAEDADSFQAAGLLSHALDLYRASLEQFADAYCIQSRLAIQLAASGDFENATKHYERAFELMPDSFGRVESHCFGCEGAFDGELASSIAERVFGKLTVERPNDPKVHYLLGYLRSSQKRFTEALPHYRRAVELDPDYVNAWSKIVETSLSIEVPPAVADEASLSIYRLAPLRTHNGARLEFVNDLKRLWQVATEVQTRFPKIETGPLYPLKAAAELHTSQNSARSDFMSFNTVDFNITGRMEGDVRSPSQLLAEHGSIEIISQLVQSALRRE